MRMNIKNDVKPFEAGFSMRQLMEGSKCVRGEGCEDRIVYKCGNGND